MSERTHQPTPRRREDARKKGQVARSQEVASAVALLAGVIALRVFGPWMMRDFTALSRGLLGETWPTELTPEGLTVKLAGLSLHVLRILLPLMACCCVGAIAANLLQSGFLFSTTPIVPDFNRINPLQGMQRLLSMRGLSELIKPLLKFGLLALVAYNYLHSQLPLLTSLSATGGLQAMSEIARVIWTLLMRVACAMLLVAAVDYLFQRHLHEKSLRMTHQDLREELRRSEGDPLVKARLRRLMQQLARGRMLQQVARATVVVTNPTHLAVALRYDPEEHPAPIVLAKGVRLVAERIKAKASEHHIPVVENPPLARALYRASEPGQPIPVDLYQAVAEIIAFVYRLAGGNR